MSKIDIFRRHLEKGGLKSRFFSSALKKGGLYHRAYPSPSHNEYQLLVEQTLPEHAHFYTLTSAGPK